MLATEWLQNDLAIWPSGSIRSDQIFPKGILTFKELFTIIQFPDEIVQLWAPGHIIKKCLENGLSCLPNTDGRFPQISGCTVKFDSTKPKFERIISMKFWNKREFADDEIYKVVTSNFLAGGGDGYKWFTDP